MCIIEPYLSQMSRLSYSEIGIKALYTPCACKKTHIHLHNHTHTHTQWPLCV